MSCNVRYQQTQSQSFLSPLTRFTSGIPYITFTVSFGLLVDLATYGIMVPVLPFRLTQLGYHHVPAKTSALIASYAAGLIISSVPIGIMGGIVKSRKVPLLICLIFLAGSLILFWLSTSFPVLVIARILQGFSGTAIWTLGMALICDTVPTERIGTIIGYVMIGWSIGTVAGPLAGGLLYDSLGYHSVFVFALILTGLDFFFRLAIPDSLIEKQDTLVIETVQEAKTGGAFGPKDEEGQLPSANKIDIAPAVISQNEDATKKGFQNAHPSIVSEVTNSPSYKPPTASQGLRSLISSSRCWTLFFIIFVLGFAFGGLMDSGMTIIVHARYGLNSRGAALVFIGAVVPSFASSPLAGHFADKYGAKWPVVICLALGTPFFGLLMMNGRLSTFIIWVALSGLFIMGISAPIMQDLSEVVKITPGLGYAHVYGIFNMVYSSGALIGPLCVGALLENVGIERGWMYACVMCTCLSGFCIVPAWLYIGNNPVDKPQTIVAQSDADSQDRTARTLV